MQASARSARYITLSVTMSRALKFDFPQWLWVVFGVSILAVSVPLAVQQATHGELLFACVPGHRSTVPLAARNWTSVGGTLAYISAIGWALVGVSGFVLCWKRFRTLAPVAGVAGFCAVVVAQWFACQTGH